MQDVASPAPTAANNYIDLPLMVGSLFNRLAPDPPQRVTMSYAFIINTMRGMLSALEHLESRNIAHFDIKPENILIDSRERSFLADFGLARQLSSQPFRGPIGTPTCAAPETLAGQLPLTTIADIWSMGITFYTLVALEFPYDQHRNGVTRDTIRAILAAQPNEPKPAYNHHRFALPEGYLALINMMLIRDRAARPSAKRLIVLFDSIRMVNPLEQQQKILQLSAELETARTSSAELNTQFGDFRRSHKDSTRALEHKNQQESSQIIELQTSLAVQLAARAASNNIIARQKLTARRTFTIQQANAVRQRYRLQQKARREREKYILEVDFEYGFMRAERDIALKRAKLDDGTDRRLADLEARHKAESDAAEEKRAELEACITSHAVDTELASTMVNVLLEAAADATAQLRVRAETAESAVSAAIEERDSALAREADRSEELSKLQLLKQQLKSSDDRRRHVERRLHQCQKALEEVCSSFYFALYIF